MNDKLKIIFKDSLKVTTTIQEKDEELDSLLFEITKEVDYLDEDKFWQGIELINAQLNKYKNNDQYSRSGKDNFHRMAIDEFIRLVTYSDDKKLYKLFQFLKTYEQKVNQVSDAFERSEKLQDQLIINHHISDDSLHDLYDSFPLHGREDFERLMNDEILLEKNYDLGENYICSTLTEVIKERSHNFFLTLSKNDFTLENKPKAKKEPDLETKTNNW